MSSIAASDDTPPSPSRWSGIVPAADITGARMLRNLHGELTRRDIAFRVVEERACVQDMLRVEGVEETVGRIDRRTSLADAIEDFQKQTVT
jgi:hypothetical protein